MTAITRVHHGFPQVSNQPIDGYMIDEHSGSLYGDLLTGLFLCQSRRSAAMKGDVPVIMYTSFIRLSPTLARFSWGLDYVFFGESAMVQAGRLLEYNLCFGGDNGQGFHRCLFSSEADLSVASMSADPMSEGRFFTDTITDDPRIPILLTWLKEQHVRKAAGLRPLDRQHYFPYPNHWHRDQFVVVGDGAQLRLVP